MAAKHSFKIDQGTDTSIHFVLKKQLQPLDLTGYKAAMQLRNANYHADAVDTLTTDNGRLVITPSEGKVTAIFPHSVTELFKPESLVYDLELESPSGEIKRVVEGRVQVIAEVTRVKCKSTI